MATSIVIALKDLRLLWRNKFGMFWVVLFPLMMALFFGSIFSSDGSDTRAMRIAFVENPSPAAQAFLDELTKSTALSVRKMPRDSALLKVSRGKLVAAVQYFASDGNGGAMMSGQGDSIVVAMDPSRRAEAGYLEGLISQAYYTILQKRFLDPSSWRPSISKALESAESIPWLSGNQNVRYRSFMTQLDTFLVSLDTAAMATSMSANNPMGQLKLCFADVSNEAVEPRSGWEVTFPQSLLWALLGCAATFALSMVIERTRGTYLRLRLAPITRAQILAGKGLACLIACVSVSVLLMGIGVLVFGVRVGSLPLLALAMISASVCFVGIMMLISVLGRTEQAVGGAGWAILLIMSMTGGGMVPLMFMPSWLATLGAVSPVRWSILALEGAIWRGFSFSEMMLPVGILLSVGIIGYGVGVTVLMRSDR